MDLYCMTPGCNEPWDAYEVQQCLAEELDITPAQALALFQEKGCEAFPGAQCAVDPDANNLRGLATAALFDLMPDDADGVAAMLDDADALGMFR